VAEVFQQHPPGFIVPHNAHRQNVHSQICQIIRGVGSSARHHGALAMFQNQYRRFARHARDLAKHKLVGHQISQNRHGDLGEGFDNLFQPVSFFGMPGHVGTP
jgi:hypothetical protein